jgi:hypothetical protein
MTTLATSYEYEDGRPSSTSSLFSGDEGTLEADQRRALVLLMKQRFMTSYHQTEWKALVANPAPIVSRLHDMFLDLFFDTEREVAYKRQVAIEGSGRPFPTLLYDAAWKREETILLVYLRSKARSEQAAGLTRVYVDRDEMLDYVRQHRPESATNRVQDEARAKNAVESLTSAGLLKRAADGDRYEISRAIEALLPLGTLKSLNEWLEGQNSPDASPGYEADDHLAHDDHDDTQEDL